MAEAATWVSPFLYGVGSLKCKGPGRGWEAAPSPTPPGGASLPGAGRGRGQAPAGEGAAAGCPPGPKLKHIILPQGGEKRKAAGQKKAWAAGAVQAGGGERYLRRGRDPPDG